MVKVPVAVGEILYRERRLELRFLWRFYAVGVALLVLSAWLIRLGTVLLGVLALIGVTGLLITTSLSVSQQARVSTYGIALPVSAWDRIARRRQRWVPREAITRISPLLALGNDGPSVFAYEIEYAGGAELFRVQQGRDSYIGHPPLIALQRMIGDRWSTVFREVPPLTAARVSWLKRQLGGPHLDKERKNRLVKVLTLAGAGAAGIGGFLSFVTEFMPGVYSAMAAMGISFAAGLLAISTFSSSEYEQIRAYWFLAQVQGGEGEGRAQSLRAIRVHPDFTCLDPRTPDRDCETRYLQSQLRRWRDPWVGILLGFSIFFFAFITSSIWLDLPLLATLLTWALGGAIASLSIRQGWKDLDQVYGAKSRLLEILAEEWRTGSPLLPEDFEIPRSVGVFVKPTTVTEFMLQKMRLAGRIDSSRLVLVAAPGGVVVAFSMFLLADLVLRNHALATLSMLAALGWAAAWYCVYLATNRGRSLLACAKVYEEATGRTVRAEEMRAPPSSG